MRMHISGIGDTQATGIGEGEVLDYEICRWASGKVYIRYLIKDLIGLLAKDMHQNIRNGYDNFVVIEGPEGSGKSNLAYAICKAFDPDFNMCQQYLYDITQFKQKLREGNDIRSTFWMDEGSNVANNREWNTQDSKNFVGILEMCRSRGYTIVMCIPTHERLDCYIRDHRMRYLIRCGPMNFANEGPKERGYFEVKKRTPYGKFETVGYGLYPKIPDDQKQIYEKIKLQSQTDMIKEVVDPSTGPGVKYKQKYEASCKQMDRILLALHDSGKSNAELMDLFGITSKKTLTNRLSRARGRADGEDPDTDDE